MSKKNFCSDFFAPSRPRMHLHHLSALALVMHGSFRGEHAYRMWPYTPPTTRQIDPDDMDGRVVSVFRRRPASVLVSQSDDDLFMFMHYNFTLVKCAWTPHVSSSDKTRAFRNLSVWLATHNQTLRAEFAEDDDRDAWLRAAEEEED